MANITRDDILKLAKLSKLHLTDDQVTHFTQDIDKIVGYAKQLDTVDVEGLEPTDQVTGLVNAWREDEVAEYQASPDELLKNAPATAEHQIKVKRVIA